jgi:hypothetical protein
MQAKITGNDTCFIFHAKSLSTNRGTTLPDPVAMPVRNRDFQPSRGKERSHPDVAGDIQKPLRN